MKKGLTFLFVLLAAFFAYRYFQDPPSEEVRRVIEMEERFQAGVRQFRQAGNNAGLGGIDATAGAGEAFERIEKVRGELEIMRSELSEDKALQRADQLRERIEAFLQQAG